jgi:hypothetical protein
LHVLQRALANRTRRHRRHYIGELYEPLAQQISLERLGQVPSYQQFVKDLDQKLTELHFLHSNPHA